jgi:hypothetical protein
MEGDSLPNKRMIPRRQDVTSPDFGRCLVRSLPSMNGVSRKVNPPVNVFCECVLFACKHALYKFVFFNGASGRHHSGERPYLHQLRVRVRRSRVCAPMEASPPTPHDYHVLAFREGPLIQGISFISPPRQITEALIEQRGQKQHILVWFIREATLHRHTTYVAKSWCSKISE